MLTYWTMVRKAEQLPNGKWRGFDYQTQQATLLTDEFQARLYVGPSYRSNRKPLVSTLQATY